MDIFSVLSMFGGLALFLFGMSLMGKGLEKLSGGKMEQILEKMTNGIPVPYIGIYGQEVTQAMRDNGIPIGVYVSECIPDSPAYYAGILSGDVIKHIAGRDVITMMDFESKVAELTVGDKVKVVVQRLGAGEYIELEYEVTVGAR